MKKKKELKKFNKFQSLFDYKYFFNDFAKITGIIPGMIFFRPKVIYASKQSKKEIKKTSCIIASNHCSFADPLIMYIIFYYKRMGIVTSKEVIENKIRRFLFTAARIIPIDKQKVSIKTFKDVKECIRRGHSVGVFPEGTVAHASNNVEAFKGGTIMMASMANAPIYPMYIIKRNKWTQRQVVFIGEKFDIKDYISSKMPSASQINELANLLFEKEQQLERKALEYEQNIRKKR